MENFNILLWIFGALVLGWVSGGMVVYTLYVRKVGNVMDMIAMTQKFNKRTATYKIGQLLMVEMHRQFGL
jgi:hypothetical protein